MNKGRPPALGRPNPAAGDKTPAPDVLPRGTETVLVVEDDDMVRDFVVQQFESLGYRVLSARTGGEAIEALDRAGTIDLLFSDIVMPGGISGIELVSHVRRKCPEICALLTSGYSEVDVAKYDELISDVCTLKKPYRRAEFARKVRETLDNRREQSLNKHDRLA